MKGPNAMIFGRGPLTNKISYRALDRDASRFARLLIELGVKKGDRVSLYMQMIPELAVAMLAWPAIQAVPWRTDYYRRLRTLSFGNVESIIFDQMLPRIANYWTRQDMERLTAALAGGHARIEFVQGNSWHASIARR